ncbi:MAG: hypothetical protein WAT20_14320 [Ferruginibacter sp.]
MNTLKVNIINPKARKLLNDLADLKLISIQDVSKTGFSSVLKKLRTKNKSAPSLDVITKEVEMARTKRYAK